jgi:hypothetical protein
MEYLNATLAGLLLWLFILHCFLSARKRTKKYAGELFLEIEKPRRSTIKKIGLFLMLVYPFLIYMFFFVFLVNSMMMPREFCILSIFCQLFIFIQSTWNSFWFIFKTQFEFREHGLFILTKFYPWEKIRSCHFSESRPTLTFKWGGMFGASLPVKVPEERKKDVLEFLASRVELQGDGIGIVSSPANITSDRISRPPLKYSRFQFDILTLLFLMVVVATFAGWYGVLLHRKEATVKQIAHFQEKYPGVDCSEYGKGITSLIFTKCKNDFTDEDLAEIAACPRLHLLFFPQNASVTDAGLARLEGLTELDYLDLSGKGITDTGLIHLYGLKKMKSLSFYGTRVTSEGIEKLQKELPNATITIH